MLTSTRPVLTKIALRTALAASAYGWIVLAGAAAQAQIAHYSGNYVNTGAGNPRTNTPDGWNYLWNSGGAIGNPANYTNLLNTGSAYDNDGVGGLPGSDPGAYVYLGSTGGHPGRGALNGGSGGIDRYAIARYTLQAGELGLVSIASSTLSVGSSGSNGVRVEVYLNSSSTPVLNFVTTPGAGTNNFNAMLGHLSPGDTVYVAFGPNTLDGADSFGMNFQLVSSPALFWDGAGTVANSAIDGGAGTWADGGTTNWTNSDGTANSAWSNAANQNAVFTTTGGAVSVPSAVTARSLSFDVNGYSLGGAGTITLTTAGTGANPAAISVVNAADTATISANLSSTATVNKIGAGAVNLSGAVNVAGLFAAGGTLQLSGTSTITGSVGVGENTQGGGEGTLSFTGGTHSIGGNLFLSEHHGIGGTVSHTGGTVTVAGQTRIAHWSNETSTYTMTGGTLNANGGLFVGWDGTGLMNVSGGVVNTGDATVWRSSTLTVSGNADFNAGVMRVGDGPRGNGTMNIQGTSTVDIGLFTIGDDTSNAGTVNQSGGTTTVSGSFLLGHYPSEASVYNMSGGALNLTGTANTEEGAGTLTIGIDGTGDFNHSGGTITAHRMHLNARTNGAGGVSTYDMTGGVLALRAGGITGNVSGSSTYAVNLGGGTLASVAGAGNSWSSPLNMTLTGIGGTTKFDTNGNTITLTGSLTGSQNVEKTDAGTLVLNGTGTTVGISNLYVTGGAVTIGGTTTATIGNVALGTDNTYSNPVVGAGGGTLNIQDSAIVNVGSFSIGDRPAYSSTVNQTGGTVSVSGGFRLGHWPSETSNYNISGGSLSLTGAPGATINPAGVGEQNGVMYLGVDGTGNLNVSGAANVNAQAIVLDARGNTGGTDTLTLTGGTITLTSTTGFGNGIRSGSLDANTSYQINLGGGTLAAGASWSSPLNMTLTGGNTTFDPNANTITLSGVLSGPGALTKVDTGTLVLSGNNSYGGGTTMSAGTLRVANFNNALGSGALNVTGSSLLATASGGGARTLANAININSGVTLSVDGGYATLTLNGPITGAGAGADLQKTSIGTVELGGTVTGLANFRVKGASGNLNILPTANITTSRLVTADEAGATTSVNQSGGTVNVTGTNSTNTTSASLLIGHWGASSAASAYNLTGGTFNSTGAMMSLGWDSSNVTFNQSSGVANLLGINLNNGRNNFAAYNLTGGTLNIGASGITTNLAKQINLGGGTVGALASWSSSQPMTLTGINGNTTFDFSGSTIALSGVMSGPGGLVKSGTGTLVTSGNNSYSGTTTLATNTVVGTTNELIVNGTTSGQGNYIVNSGARLGGDGTIGLAGENNVFISGTPGDLSPGDKGSMPLVSMPSGSRVASYSYSAALDPQTVGTLTILGDVDLDGYLIIDLVSPASHDILNVAEDFAIDSGADLEINGKTDLTQLDFGALGLTDGAQVVLVNAGLISGNFGNTSLILNRQFVDAGGNDIFFGQTGTSIFLQAVPEPASIVGWLLVGIVVVGIAARQVRRRRG